MTDYEMVQAAIKGERGADQERIAEAGMQLIAKLLCKNSDYGSSVWRVPRLAPDTGVAAAILVRMSDKVERIIALTSRDAGPEVVDESLMDTLDDLVAYKLLLDARPEDAA